MAGLAGEYSGFCAIDVTPNSMSTTITKIDTGDGILWVGNAIPAASGTGDYSFQFRATQDNPSSLMERSFIARISDSAGIADSVDVVVTQEPAFD